MGVGAAEEVEAMETSLRAGKAAVGSGILAIVSALFGATISARSTVNFYRYPGNTPTDATDPSGLRKLNKNDISKAKLQLNELVKDKKMTQLEADLRIQILENVKSGNVKGGNKKYPHGWRPKLYWYRYKPLEGGEVEAVLRLWRFKKKLNARIWCNA